MLTLCSERIKSYEEKIWNLKFYMLIDVLSILGFCVENWMYHLGAFIWISIQQNKNSKVFRMNHGCEFYCNLFMFYKNKICLENNEFDQKFI